MISEINREYIDNTLKFNSDIEKKSNINKNIAKFNEKVKYSKLQYSNFNLAKSRAASIKHKVLNYLDKYLVEFEANFTKRGGKVIWAIDSKQALEEIYNIILKHDAKNIIKTKSSVLEEIELCKFLKDNKLDVKETNIGDFILKLFNEKNYHFNSSLINLNKKEISKIISNKFDVKSDLNEFEITDLISDVLNDYYSKADIGITGGNYLLADIGALVLSENEGNILKSVSYPKIHIAVVSIEKVIPSIQDLDLLIPLNSVHTTGQKINTYNTILTGPKQDNEIDGPIEMYVILLDNNRTEILAKKEQRKALSCIKCGLCINICPISKFTDINFNKFVYEGPVGAIVTPYLKGFKDYSFLSYNSTLCGKCTEVCPVNIPLHELIIHNRNEIVKNKESNIRDKIILWSLMKMILNRKYMNFKFLNIKNKVIHIAFGKEWSTMRQIPLNSNKTFNNLWKEKREIK